MEVKLNRVSYIYNLGTKLEHSVFNQINATFDEGKITVIIGRSGSGKTTLLELLAGLISPNKGEIQFTNQGKESNYLRPYLLFKNPADQFIKRTIKEELGLSISHLDRIEREKRIIQGLKQVGLDDSYLNRDILKLSHSEMHKIMVASLLISNSKIVLLDEPTIGLDSKNKQELIRLIRKLKSQKRLIIIASNDIEFIYKIADYIYVLNNGKITLRGNKYDVITNSKFRKIFHFPKLVEFILQAQSKGLNLDYCDDTKDLMKDIYRHVTK